MVLERDGDLECSQFAGGHCAAVIQAIGHRRASRLPCGYGTSLGDVPRAGDLLRAAGLNAALVKLDL